MDSYLAIPQTPEVVSDSSIRLIVFLPEAPDPGPADTLANIIKACGLDVERQTRELIVPPALAMGNTTNYPPSARFVSFGVAPGSLGLQHVCLPYRWLAIGGREWCFAERLEVIGADMERKKRLWACLKDLKS